MRDPDRLYDRLTKEDLNRLRELALQENDDFFRRNDHLHAAYGNSFIDACLCQGAASHYVNPKVGVKDFDIWHFYVEHSDVAFNPRAHRRLEDGYRGKAVDFLKRAIPQRICAGRADDAGRVIMDYLNETDTETKQKLLEKAIVGLAPGAIFGYVLWKGYL